MKTTIQIGIVTALICIVTLAHSQNERRHWYFGNKAGLDFSTTPPTALFNGSMTTGEGCATISDAAGNLLFYTDGITVYNSTHQVMANGTGLKGNGSTTQSGIIIQQPGSTSLYYVFTQDDIGGPDGFCYSLVDMSLAAGLGSVTAKNVNLYTPSTEKITGARHCNGIDAWVISHDFQTDTFRTYLITAAGINTVPVISEAGPNTTTNYQRTLGQMKISPSGNKLGLVIYDTGNPGSAELYDFDPSTGMVSNALILGSYPSPYGCEFSPDGTKFYGGLYSSNKILQWNLCAGTDSAIKASCYTITTKPGAFGSLQVAPDGKIYVARSGQTKLGAINNPDVAGSGCNYADSAVSIAPRTSALGLPNFLNIINKIVTPQFTTSVNCNIASFVAPAGSTVQSVCGPGSSALVSRKWDFGDPASGAANFDTQQNPSHTYGSPGTYNVKLIVNYTCSSDTLEQTVTVSQAGLSVKGNSVLCRGETRTITASGATSYTWNTGAHTPTISIAPLSNTLYIVSGNTGSNCNSTLGYSVTVKICMGLDLNGDVGSRLYPNPVKDFLYVSSPSAVKVVILNSLGSVILEKEISSGDQRIDLQALPDGIYSVKTSNNRNAYLLVKIH